MNSIKSETPPPYAAPCASSDDGIIALALEILAARVDRGQPMTSPAAAIQYFKLRAASSEREEFVALFLDSQNRVLDCRVLFTGTINSAAVYPREVVKAALACNSAAVILSHNHPSGLPEPSQSDRAITDQLKAALALVDVRVLDHIVTGGADHVSFAERGWI